MSGAASEPAARGRARAPLYGAIPWLIALLCFAYLYTRLSAAAQREGLALLPYLGRVFAGVSWSRWLALMVPYSLLYFLIDSAVVWRVVSWFNTPIAYRDVLPIRGSSFILSLFNEQVGKGAMGLYLHRRHGVAGWEVASSMLFIMLCEFYYLLSWATLGWALHRERLPEPFDLVPLLATAAAVAFVALVLLFRTRLGRGWALRERPLLRAFRRARAWQYLAILALRSPAMLAAAWVYARAASLFGVEIPYTAMLGYLPLVFFGASTPGPMRSVAIALWVVLFPGREGAMAAFGFVQHNFFILFNAALGLLFLRRAQRELFGPAAEPDPASTAPSSRP